MTNENALKTIETFCGFRKDKRYRAGFIDAMRHTELITQRQRLELRTELTGFKRYAEHDHNLKLRGE